MIVVMFELEAVEGQGPVYVDLVNKLTPLLKDMEGFLGVECFQSTQNPKKVMSVTNWRDMKAVEDWRNVSAHLNAQRAGRNKIFHNYRVRVTEVLRDYGMTERAQAPHNVVFDGEETPA
ncbi:antibiotic biosynthesis monooxygenase family protein [Pseudomonas oryzicola]|uniref:Antibiotic biosynthesis monooxygenase n=1 Tax=Pseudomonas oryzicola TaxID=485876 RepID=A0ABS6QGN8_9PSED|nr:antibiotic biosynthesis monooxygenase [Pseudomonas oryzicola]MBV4493345.1 antibiotic biosynthesis monooxygenase [Pseudomonas oryzicola]